MGSLTNYAENELLDHLLNAAYSPAATVYLGFATASPGEGATGAACNEVANANGYARKAITFGAASVRTITQSANVTFDPVTGAGYTTSDWFISDSVTHGAGNILAYGTWDTARVYVAGNIPFVTSTQTDPVAVTVSAGIITSVVARKLLDLMFRDTAYAKPDTYLTVTTATIADGDTSVTEPSGGAFARVQVNINGGAAPDWSTVVGGAADNTDQVDFGIPASSPTITTIACVSSASGACDILSYYNALADQVIVPGDTMYVEAGAYDWTLD